MSIHEPPADFGFAVPPAPITHRFTVEQYHRMIETGILTENDKVHLIEGCILEMTPIGVPHRYAVDEVYHAVERLLPTGWKAVSNLNRNRLEGFSRRKPRREFGSRGTRGGGG
jgi:Uma2 family endonuclease